MLAERRDGTFVDLDVRIECSSGTYIRALARDLGAAVSGVGGHLTALRRTRVGPFRIEDAVADPDELAAALRTPAVDRRRALPDDRRSTPSSCATSRTARSSSSPSTDTEVLAALTTDGRLAGLVAVKKGAARVLVNFPTSEVLA